MSASVLFLFLVVLGLIYMTRIYILAYRSKNWKEIAAIVVNIVKRSNGSVKFVKYNYAYIGLEYESDKYSIESGRFVVSKSLDKCETGDSILVYVDPCCAHRSVIQKGFLTSLKKFFIALFIVFLYFCVLISSILIFI